MPGIYLDHAATTVMAPEVASHLIELYRLNLANPSAGHTSGALAAEYVENARGVVAQKINADPSEIIFNSGGTEGNNWVLQRVVEDARFRGINSPTSLQVQ